MHVCIKIERMLFLQNVRKSVELIPNSKEKKMKIKIKKRYNNFEYLAWWDWFANLGICDVKKTICSSSNKYVEEGKPQNGHVNRKFKANSF